MVATLLMFCLLLCMHYWIGLDHVKARRCIYFWATVNSTSGGLSSKSRAGPKSSSHRQQVKTHLFVLMLLCIIHETGVAEARIVTFNS